jgi:3-oxoacyl-[acyl-carrier-protein] synthase II
VATNSNPMQKRRVAITGLGVVAHAGTGVEAFWQGLLTSNPGDASRRIEDFDASPLFESPKDARRTDRFTQLALMAATEAVAMAGDIGIDPSRIGTLIGTGIGGIETLEEQIVVHHEKGARRVSPFLVPMMMPNAAVAAVSMRFGFEGPCEATTTACAAGTHSIGNAWRLIAMGICDAVIAGGTESAMTNTAMAGFGNMTALSTSGWSRPFDTRRDGFVMAEGAGVIVLEEWEHAVARGATIYAEMMGAASTADAHHITAPAPGGAGAVRCMELAIASAGLQPSDIGHINAHGTSTPLNDAAEAQAVNKVFGSPGPIVTSTKGVTGHALGAAGAIEAVALALSIQRGLVPPTRGTDVASLDPECTIDLVLQDARPWTPAPALSNSFGFGGHNGTIVMGPATK